MAEDKKQTASADKPTIVKKYANRRLYDTGRSSYVTLEDLCEMVQEGRDFVVIDAKTEEDLTRQILTQIIVEQEAKGENLLPISFLRELIGYYGDSLQAIVPPYLDQALETLKKNQKDFQDQLNRSLGAFDNAMNPAKALEDISRKNMEMFQTAFQAWNPFAPAPDEKDTAASNEDIQSLKQTISELQAEITRLKKEAGKGGK